MTVPHDKPQQHRLSLVFALLALGIGAVDYAFYRAQKATIVAQAQAQLSAIADLKVEQIASWRRERYGDAVVVHNNALIGEMVTGWLGRRPDALQRQKIEAWLQSFVRSYDYREALLLDARGEILVATANHLPLFERSRELLRDAGRADSPRLSDLEISLGMERYMEVAVPLRSTGHAEPQGFLLLRIDPQRVLFPLIQSQPLPSASAETLLVEKRGDSVLYLNDLRHSADSALRLALPADRESLPAARAVQGQPLLLEGVDYRGIEVLAATRPIPDSPWSLVVKTDMREVLAPINERFVAVAVLSLLLLALTAGFTRRLWRAQREVFLGQHAAERKAALEIARSHERLLAAQRIAHLGSWERRLSDNALWWSDETYHLLHYTPGEHIPSRSLFYDRVHPEDRARVRHALETSSEQGQACSIAYRVLLPSGEVRRFENTSHIVRDADDRPQLIVGTLQDVTEKHRIEAQLRRQSAQLAAVLENMPQGISVFDEHLRLQLWNAELIEILELPPEIVVNDVPLGRLLRIPAERGEYGPGDPEALVRERVALAGKFLPHRFERVRPNGKAHLVQGRPYHIDGQLAGFITTYTDITDRRNVELQLQKQNALLDTIIENIPGGVSLMDGKLDIVAANREFRRLLDLPDTLFERMPVPARTLALFNARRGEYGPGDPEALAEAMVARARQHVAHLFERTRPDGTVIEVRGMPLPGGGFVTVYTDITERRRTEQARQDLSTRLTLATSAAAIGIWDWHVPDDRLIWDARMYELYGLPPDSPALRDWLSMVHPADQGRVRAAMRAALAGLQRHFDIDFRIVRADGQLRHINTQAGVEQDDSGQVLRIVGANIDITARCQAEERLQLAEKVFDNSPDAIMITDRDNRIVSVNEAFTLITGYAPGEVLGGNPRLLASGRHDDAFYAAMWRALREHGHWAGEIWDRRKSGEIYPKWMTINAVADRQSGELTHYVTMFSDITERKSSEERIHYLAHHDVLTGLPNRFTLGARLDQALVDARRHQWEVAVLFVDLDRFKIINDTLGHHIGDRLLIEVARRFSAVVRESDIVARLGGDEFVIVLPDLAGHTDAATVAGKIIASLAVPVRIDDHELHTSPSIGISLFPVDGSDSDTILRNADTAMYHAKSLGRNNFQFYAEEMNRSTRERLDIERRLRQALARNECELHYQPQFDTRAHRIAGVEALLRWNAGTGIPLGPDRFIPIAEESGLIVTLGEWVLQTACRQMKQWIDAGLPPLRVAVNVSPRQLHRQNFPEQVAAALAESGLPAHLLELEITESAVMEEPEEARAILVRLKEMGITLAIDDFGTGYSSLAYLKRFPIDHLKIDRSFVTDIEHDANDAAIVVSIIALARSLGLKTIAEGVESDAQLALLREHGCDELQGYLFSRPLPAAAARDYLAAALAAPPAIPLSSS